MNLNKKNKELLMYCALAFVAGYLMCMYYPVHSSNNGYSFSLLEGNNNNNNGTGNGTGSGNGTGTGNNNNQRRQGGGSSSNNNNGD